MELQLCKDFTGIPSVTTSPAVVFSRRAPLRHKKPKDASGRARVLVESVLFASQV